MPFHHVFYLLSAVTGGDDFGIKLHHFDGEPTVVAGSVKPTVIHGARVRPCDGVCSASMSVWMDGRCWCFG